MSSSPFFSIIIPTYNRPTLAERAIESVLKQECQDFEILLIDDGSLEDYTELIQKYQSENKFTYHKQKNAYLPSARNKGIQLANGRWICFLDDDDYYLNNHLSCFKECIEQNLQKLGMYRTFTIFENEKLERVFQPITKLSGNVLEYVLNISTITVNNVCLSAEVLNDLKFNTDLKIAEDYNLWLRILCQYPLFESYHHTTVYFKSEDTMSGYNFLNAGRYLQSYYITFSSKDVIDCLNFVERLAHLNKYLIRYFDCALKENGTINKKLIGLILFKFPSIKIMTLCLKYFCKKTLRIK